MNKLLKSKKVHVAILVICVLVLMGVIIGITMKGNKVKTETGKTGSGQDVIIHGTDGNTVEEKDKGGLTESDSEDGPVLNEENMIDFNGSDVNTENNQSDGGKTDSETDENESAGNEGSGNNGNDSEEDNADDSTNENPKIDDEEDTGSWGAFY